MLPYIKNKVASWRYHLLEKSIDMNQKRCQVSCLIQKKYSLNVYFKSLARKESINTMCFMQLLTFTELLKL